MEDDFLENIDTEYENQQQVSVEPVVSVPSETLSCELEGRIKELEYWRDFIFRPRDTHKATVSLYDFQVRLSELKASKH